MSAVEHKVSMLTVEWMLKVKGEAVSPESISC